MAIVMTKKDAGGGWFEIVVGTDNADSVGVSQRSTIAIIRFNKGAFAALGANGQADLQGAFFPDVDGNPIIYNMGYS